MGDNWDNAYNKLKLYHDKVGREKTEHQVDKSRTKVLNPSKLEHIKGFTIDVSLLAELNSRKLAFHLVIAIFFRRVKTSQKT